MVKQRVRNPVTLLPPTPLVGIFFRLNIQYPDLTPCGDPLWIVDNLLRAKKTNDMIYVLVTCQSRVLI